MCRHARLDTAAVAVASASSTALILSSARKTARPRAWEKGLSTNPNAAKAHFRYIEQFQRFPIRHKARTITDRRARISANQGTRLRMRMSYGCVATPVQRGGSGFQTFRPGLRRKGQFPVLSILARSGSAPSCRYTSRLVRRLARGLAIHLWTGKPAWRPLLLRSLR